MPSWVRFLTWKKEREKAPEDKKAWAKFHVERDDVLGSRLCLSIFIWFQVLQNTHSLPFTYWFPLFGGKMGWKPPRDSTDFYSPRKSKFWAPLCLRSSSFC